MITFNVRWDGYEDLSRYIQRVSDGLTNLGPLLEQIAEIIEEDHLRARLMGIDVDGKPLAKLAKSTWKGRLGTGPPLVPRNAGSRVVQTFDVTPISSGDDHYIVGTYGNAPWLKYHGSGPEHAKHLPIRDIEGITPYGREKISAAIDAYLYDLVYGDI